MALSTAGDVVNLALRAAGVMGAGQTALPQDIQDGLDLANALLTEWQINRWLVFGLLDALIASTAASSYTVGPAATIVTEAPRPDKIDAAFARLISTGQDTPLYPYMSREGYDRVPLKSLAGIPERFFYDPGLGAMGTVYFTPVPSALYSLHLNFKAPLLQLASIATPLTLPPPYTVALLWNLAADLRPIFQKPEDHQVTARAMRSLLAIGGSVAQVPNAVQPIPSPRAGIFSTLIQAGQPRQ